MRDYILDFVKRDLIGPDPSTTNAELIQSNGEEILTESPIRRYLAAILFSKGYGNDLVLEEDEVEEDIIGLANASFQSAMGITVAIKNGDHVKAIVNTAFYNQESGPNNTLKYLRLPILWDSTIQLPTEKGKIHKLQVYLNDGRKVLFDIICRQRYEEFSLFTFTLENASKNEPNDPSGKFCMFQNEFRLISSIGFQPLPDSSRAYQDEDFESNTMLYRDEKKFSIGHGCSTTWKLESDNSVRTISTSIFPEYEMIPIVPSKINGVSLEMYRMSKEEIFDETMNELKTMCFEYEKWIDNLENTIVDERDIDTKKRHIENCRICLERMNGGISLLETNKLVRKAFQYMNKAMLMQQLHYNLPTQEWKLVGKDFLMQRIIDKLPDIDDQSTWYGDKARYGKWRPFQLTFVLINLKSMLDKNCHERKIVDLIWFPTGGGKTEAYLGLSAYTIFLRKLQNREDNGTAIIMRYTLRLLTNQQYQRASSLICAIEKIRQEKSEELGIEPVTIGLWVGGETSPNKTDDAFAIYNKRLKNETKDNPFIVLKCPWCGSEMGFKDKDRDNSSWVFPVGYDVSLKPYKRFLFRCSNPECHYGPELPLRVIDEDIYKNPPTLLIGTVDKFATIPLKPESRSLFGLDNNGKNKNTPPDLIIQDELHLISGPLGTMVGHYEMLIEELCTQREGSQIVHFPKVIASTATISRAREQCKALYCRNTDEIFQFPPSGISYRDSFFAEADGSSDGRKYVGIFCSNLKYSAVTAVIRFYADIAYARQHIVVSSEKNKDAYWTHVGYFNSIRELGRMKSYVTQEVGEYIKVLDDRYGTTGTINMLNDLELTSRIDSGEIPEALKKLEIGYDPDKGGSIPIDVCLASNMISVGIDVPRLGLMSVAGQPKTTSEYIQATSRVGRSLTPGLVFIIYTCTKPRDRSHYEQFQDYHSKIYCYVEPTSVTPFSGPVRERALGALLVAYMRLRHPEIEKIKPIIPKDEWFDEFKSIVVSRAMDISPDELDDTIANVDKLIQEWKRKNPEIFGNPYMKPKPNQLLTVRGEHSEYGYVIPTSMRSVDASCNLIELKAKYGK
jgi:hypothetical protein